MTDQADARAQARARLLRASAALLDHTRACASCAEQIATDPDDAPDCTVGARVYGDWLAAALSLATSPRATN